jgi:hypothetical protein
MKERTRSINWRAAALGGAAGMMTVVTITAIGAGLMAKGVVGLDSMSWWAVGIVLFSGMVCALAARLGGGGEVEGALAASGELVVLTALNGALCDWKMEGAGVTILALAGGCGAAMLLAMNRGHHKRRRRRR